MSATEVGWFTFTDLPVSDPTVPHHEVVGHQRTMLQLTVGTIAHRDTLRAIELLGTEVAPAVRAEVARREHPEPALTPAFTLLPGADGVGVCDLNGDCA